MPPDMGAISQHPPSKAGIWIVDFEYGPVDGVDGNSVEVRCMTACDAITGKMHRLWCDKLLKFDRAPFPTDDSAVFVAYNACAEMECFNALGWPYPTNIVDMYAEFRNATNGLPVPAGNGLLGALAYFGLPCMDAAEKTEMRQLVLRGAPYSAAEKGAILKYCERDVEALARLFAHMDRAGLIDWPRALWRGQYSIAAAAASANGIPIDTQALHQLRTRGSEIAKALISRIDQAFGVYDGVHFRIERFRKYLESRGIPVPLTATGRVSVSDDTMAELVLIHPQLAPLRQLRKSLTHLRDIKLTVGQDGRNRFSQFPFASITGRNQPSTTKAVFGLPSGLRPLIRPEEGSALAYVDYGQQEPGEAAKFSGDAAMQAAYRSEDFHMSSAIRAGVAPLGATKQSHPEVRENFKQIALGLLYGMSEHGLARRLAISQMEARQLLDAHRKAFPIFWQWSDAVVDHALLTGKLSTVFGWTLHLDRSPNVRSLRNFLMQANGAEMLRLASVGLIRRGIRICALVHDAVLIESPEDDIDAAVAVTRDVMREASMLVLDGFEIKTDARIIRFPDRFIEPKGELMWNQLMALLNEFPRAANAGQ